MTFYNYWLLDDFGCAVIVRRATEKRLSKTCFRGRSLKRAGNFFLWSVVGELLRDPFIKDELMRELCDIFAEETFKEYESVTKSFVIDYGSPVGWSSTAPLASFTNDILEPFNLTRRATCLRVKSNSPVLAPQTTNITFVIECKLKRGDPVAIVHSIYPGEDIGPLKGDVTKREGVAFFGWDYVGA